MSLIDLNVKWSNLVASHRTCQRCKMNCDSALLHEGARPLFGRFTPWKNGLLFVFEALNPEDTRDPNKGYLTYDQRSEQQEPDS